MPRQEVQLSALAEVNSTRLTLSEDASGAMRKLEGVVARVNVVNKNNRFYSREVFEKALAEVAPSVSEGDFTGELDHPEWSALGSLEKTAFVFDRLYLDGDLVKFEARLLETPAGTTLRGLLDGGVRVGMSTRGTATVKWERQEGDKDGPEIAFIQDDYSLYGVDAVKVPSNEAGVVRLRESIEARIHPQQSTAIKEKESDVSITTLEGLRTEYPELVREAEEATRTAATEPLEAQVAELEGQVATFEADLTAAREAATALEAAKTEADASVEALTAQVAELTASLESLETEKTQLTLEGALKAAFDEVAAESEFADLLRDEIDPLSFSDVETLKSEVARVEKVAKRAASIATAKGKGHTNVDEDADANRKDPITERQRKLAGIEG